MPRRERRSPAPWSQPPGVDIEGIRDHFAARVERNKTRRRKDDEPPAAAPVPADPPKGGGTGGAAAIALELDYQA